MISPALGTLRGDVEQPVVSEDAYEIVYIAGGRMIDGRRVVREALVVQACQAREAGAGGQAEAQNGEIGGRPAIEPGRDRWRDTRDWVGSEGLAKSPRSSAEHSHV